MADPVCIVFATTTPQGCMFLKEPINALRRVGFDAFLVSSAGEQLDQVARETGAQSAAIPIRRDIAPLHDLMSLWRLYRLIRRVRPRIVTVGEPKAGLLGGIAAWLAGVSVRVYILHGLRLETTKGIEQRLLTLTERIACACAQRVICVSPSLRQRAVELRLVPAEKAVMLGSGSFGGIDVRRFSPQVRNSTGRDPLARSLGLAPEATVIGFVGRLTRDKGIEELLEAYSCLSQKWPKLYLLLVGGVEKRDKANAYLMKTLAASPSIVHVGFVRDPAPYYTLMDVLVLPSHREGLGHASLEAQACGVPVVTTNATGAIDSIVDRITGFAVPVGNAVALAARIDQLLSDTELRLLMGQKGREWVVREFREELVSETLAQEYQRMLRGLAKSEMQAAQSCLPGS